MYPRIGTLTRAFHHMTSTGSSRAGPRLQLMKNHLRLSSSVQNYKSITIGAKYTKEYKNYAVDANTDKVLSYFHDVPLKLNKQDRTVTMVVEVPRWLNGKFEIDLKQPGNPIVQDVKKDEVRFVRNLFPYHGYIHNYGAIPQTWEDPNHKSAIQDLYGDGDPLDVCEIGSRILPTGTITTVKILGSIALVDDGELDWKVIAISVDDEMAPELNDISDVENKCPRLLEATKQWFKDYKKPDGKPENVFALNGEFLGAEETWRVIEECHREWRKLVEGNAERKGASIENVTLAGTPGHKKAFEFNDSVIVAAAVTDALIPDHVHKSFYY